MNKKKIAIIVALAIITSIITYLNYDKIEEYIVNKQWQMADSIATIQMDDVNQVMNGKNLILLTKNSIDFYKDSANKEKSIPIVTSEILTSVANEYTVIGEKTSGNIYMLKEDIIAWESKANGTILDVVVNKNGYVAVTYYQSGYKSVIKVFKPNGEELFTTFLASTYAIDVAIADNNKLIAVAEVDTEGIRVTSNVKIIEVNNNNETRFNTIYTDNDSLILDVEYTDKNTLFILKDDGVVSIDKEKNTKNVLTYDYSEIVYSTIENGKNIVVVRKAAVGIFGSECVLEIYDEKGKEEYKLTATPQSICVQNKTIVLNMGNEVIFVGTNGKLIKRYTLGSQLKDIKLYENGNMAALVFRNKIELVKI